MKTNVNKIVRNSFIGVSAMLIIGSLIPGLPTEEILVNEFIKNVKSKLLHYNEVAPEEKVYLQFDKTLYKPGETIWFSAYVRDGESLNPSRKSEILHVELIDPKGNVSRQIALIARKGVAKGDFALDGSVPGGLYKVKAFTNWQKNFGEGVFFTKDIQVQSVVIPRLLMKMDFTRKAYGPGDEVIAKINLNTLDNNALADYGFGYVVNIDGRKLMEKKSETDNTGEAYVKFELPEDLSSNDGILNVMVDYEGRTESISRSVPITLGNIDLTFYPEGGDLVEGLESQLAFKALNEFGKPADLEGVVFDQSGSKVAEFSSFHNGMGSFGLDYRIGESYVAKITKPAGIAQEYPLPEPLRRGWVMHVEQDGDEALDVEIRSTENEQMSLLCQVRGKIYYTRALEVKRGRNSISIPTASFPAGVVQITLFDGRNIERCERLAFVNKDRQMHIEVRTDKEKYLPREKVKMSLRVTDERGLPIPANLSLAVVDDKLLSFADDKSGNILSTLLLESDIRSKVEDPAFYFDPKEEKADKALDFLLMTDGWRRFKWEQIIDEDIPPTTFDGEMARIGGTVYDYNAKPVTGATVTAGNKTVKTDENGHFEINDLDLYTAIYMNVSAKGLSSQSIYLSGYNRDLRLTLYDQRVYSYSTRGGGIYKRRKMIPKKAAGAGGIDVIDEDRMVLEEVAMPVEEEDIFIEAAAQAIKDDGIVMKDKKEEKADLLVGEVEEFAWDARQAKAAARPMPAAIYYRAREFDAPEYKPDEQVEYRNDFRSTIFWNGNLEVDRSGKAELVFCNSDEVSSFRITVEGIGVGLPGHAEKKYFTQLPFSMSTKVPAELVSTDVLSIPLTLKNNTSRTVNGKLEVQTPDAFEPLTRISGTQSIPAHSAKTLYLSYKVLNKPGEHKLNITFRSGGLKDAYSQKIHVVSKGFPVSLAFSGQDADREYKV
ncbi:MAG: MG2 domain-containing protein, partial [Flavobacteriales bacterium]